VNNLCASLALPTTAFAADSTIFHFAISILTRYNCLSLSTSTTFLSTNQIIMTASSKPTYPKEITINNDLTCTSASQALPRHTSPTDNHFCGDSSHILTILVVTFFFPPTKIFFLVIFFQKFQKKN